MEINKDSIAFTKRTLHNYFYLKQQEMYYRRIAMEKQLEIEEEMKVNGMPYDTEGDGCSVNYPKDSYINQLIKEQACYDLEANRCHKQLVSLDLHNRIENRLDALPASCRELIFKVFRENTSYKDISKSLFGGYPSKQAVNDRVNDAIRLFLTK